MSKLLPFLILLLSLGLRGWDIGRRDFWYDEAYTGNVLRLPWGEFFAVLAYDVHPPLYYTLLKLYALLLGDGVIALRSFSAIWGIASVLLVYAIGKELFDRKTALYAMLLACVSPFLIQYSQETRMYSLYAGLILLAFYTFLKAQRTKRTIFVLTWGLALGLACLTHYMAFLFIPCFILVAVLGTERSWAELKRFVLGMSVAALVFLPWLSTFIDQFRRSDEVLNGVASTRFENIFLILQIFFFGMPQGELVGFGATPNILAHLPSRGILWGVVLFVLVMAIWAIRKEKSSGLVITFFSLGNLLITYIVGLLGEPFLSPRYVIPAALFLCLLIATGVRHLPRVGVVLVFGVYGALLLLIQPLPNSEGYNLFKQNLAQFPDAHFYSLNTFDYMIAKYYLGGPEQLTLYNVGWPQYDSRGWPGIGWKTKRTETIEDIKNDPHALIIRNVQFPLELRDDRYFDTTPFELVATFKNIEVYRYRNDQKATSATQP